ncbi:hypothetical protein HW517_10765 [Asaia spathodeae]
MAVRQVWNLHEIVFLRLDRVIAQGGERADDWLRVSAPYRLIQKGKLRFRTHFSRAFFGEGTAGKADFWGKW